MINDIDYRKTYLSIHDDFCREISDILTIKVINFVTLSTMDDEYFTYTKVSK